MVKRVACCFDRLVHVSLVTLSYSQHHFLCARVNNRHRLARLCIHPCAINEQLQGGKRVKAAAAAAAVVSNRHRLARMHVHAGTINQQLQIRNKVQVSVAGITNRHHHASQLGSAQQKHDGGSSSSS
jgi:hypothetical protein